MASQINRPNLEYKHKRKPQQLRLDLSGFTLCYTWQYSSRSNYLHSACSIDLNAGIRHQATNF
jgi:hypothetical protein